MALIGTLAELKAQLPQHAGLQKGLDYLMGMDIEKEFAALAGEKSRKIEIVGTDVFAIVQEYQPKEWETIAFEGHRTYIDIQCVFGGEEMLLQASTGRVTRWGEYSEDRDIHFSDVDGYSSFMLRPGDACILWPTDMHAPCMKARSTATVRKVVVKVKL